MNLKIEDFRTKTIFFKSIHLKQSLNIGIPILNLMHWLKQKQTDVEVLRQHRNMALQKFKRILIISAHAPKASEALKDFSS